ncbi:hypothetical protein V1509DRAFT_620206 [Lipomyces kononenkoae]
MSILESERYALEDLDRLEKAIADRFLEPPRTHRDRISQEQEIASFLDRIQHQSKYLLDSFEDAQEERAPEIVTLQGGETANQFDEFYKQLKSIKDFHRRYPNQPVENLEENYRKKRKTDDDSPDLDLIDTMFTGEEALGKYLDLIAFHERYLNLRGTTHVQYVQYLDIFDKFEQMSKTPKDDEYFKYTSDLSAYLEGFLKRSQPLSDPEGTIAKIEQSFNEEWENKFKQNGTGVNHEQNGPNGDGIYCDACEKMFEKQTVYDGHLSGKKHKKNIELKEKAGANGASALAANLKARAISLREFEIRKLAEILGKAREETKINVERKSALTLRERQLEMEALEREELGGDEDGGGGDQEDDGKVYNPLKLPIGWDGKPIPFWLWKLHGLGVEYPCEICGNFVYMGRKAFDKHFMEARHVHGLRCLGIQNSALFREITSIQDALALWDKIKKERRAQESMREQAVEVEDDEGNVMSEKVYNDLKKQGLL